MPHNIVTSVAGCNTIEEPESELFIGNSVNRMVPPIPAQEVIIKEEVIDQLLIEEAYIKVTNMTTGIDLTKKEAEDLENKLRKERESNPIYKTEELISNPPIIVKENSRISKLDKKKKEIKQVTNESTEVKE